MNAYGTILEIEKIDYKKNVMAGMRWTNDWIKDVEEKNTGNFTVGDPRSEFERDYDRALFATPVRRLQDKAQVFPLEPHDSIRTRLTHSLEVSGIARTLGFYCSHLVQKKEKKRLKRDISRELEFLCLT